MLGSIKYNLANLLNFEGRDARQTFWYYVLFLIILQFAVGMISAIPMYIGIMESVFSSIEGAADPQEMNATMYALTAEHLPTQMAIGSALGVISAALISAAFVRRLHDSGKPGWILLLALAPYFLGLFWAWASLDETMVIMEQMMTATNPADQMAAQSRLYVKSAVSYLGYLIVIGFGVLKSDEGPNQYGDDPVKF